MKEIYSIRDKTNPSLLGLPTSSGDTTENNRFIENLAIDAVANVSLHAHVGTAFTTTVEVQKDVVSGAAASKTLLWVPPKRMILTAVALKVEALAAHAVTTPPSLQWEIAFTKVDQTTSLPSVFAAGSVLTGNANWSDLGGNEWGYGALSLGGNPVPNTFINTPTWTTINIMGLYGDEKRGWCFDGDVKDGSAVLHDRFVLSTVASVGVPAAQTTTYTIRVVFSGFLT